MTNILFPLPKTRLSSAIHCLFSFLTRCIPRPKTGLCSSACLSVSACWLCHTRKETA